MVVKKVILLNRHILPGSDIIKRAWYVYIKCRDERSKTIITIINKSMNWATFDLPLCLA